MTTRRTNVRLGKELAILGILAVAIAGFTILQFGKPKTTVKNEAAPRLQTTFDTEAAEMVKQKDTSVPAINADGVGRTDPFAP